MLMPPKTAFLLFVLSFIAGFVLRDMLLGVSSGLDKLVINNDITGNELGGIKPINAGTPAVAIEKMRISRKAMRGHFFEMLLSLKPLRPIDEGYDLIVYFCAEKGKIKIKSGRYGIALKTGLLQGEIREIGPLRIVVPAAIPLGKYRIEVGIISKDAADEDYVPLSYANGEADSIEVVDKYLK